MSIYIGPLIAQSVRSLEATDTSTIAAGTGADTLMTSMTITPSAGVYNAWFSCDINSTTAGAVTNVSIYVGGVQIGASSRKVAPLDGGLGSSASARGGIATQAFNISVNGTQAIEVRWSASAGTNTAGPRTLSILKVG